MTAVPSTKELIRALREQQWNVSETKRGHFRARPPDGGDFVVFCDTGDPRGMKNNLAQLRRGGFEWPWRKPKPEPAVVARGKAIDVDALFADLKEAKAELDRTVDTHKAVEREVEDIRRKLAEAEARVATSATDVEAAQRLVAEAKALFDAAFEGNPL